MTTGKSGDDIDIVLDLLDCSIQFLSQDLPDTGRVSIKQYQAGLGEAESAIIAAKRTIERMRQDAEIEAAFYRVAIRERDFERRRYDQAFAAAKQSRDVVRDLQRELDIIKRYVPALANCRG